MKNNYIIYIFLFILNIVFSCIFFLNSDISPTVLSFDHSKNTIRQENGGLRGEFVANNNYLGMLTLRFDNKDIVETNSIFRIKEKGSSKWYHSSSIDTVQYNIKPRYTFGLPVIADSKDKLYEFEIVLPEYLHEEPSLSLSAAQPVLVSHYVFPAKALIKSRTLLLDFVKQKLSYQIHSPFAPRVFFAYSVPLLAFALYSLFLVMKFPIFWRLNPLSVLALIGMVFDIGVLRNHYALLALILAFVWIAGVYQYKIKPETSIFVTLAFLILCPFFLVAHMEWVTEKSANWMFILVSVGFFQYFFEQIKTNE